jgi:FkbM family methyltransferase
MTFRLAAGYRLLRTLGVRSFVATLFYRANLKIKIYLRGRNKVVSLDGCEFPLSSLPDTEMKLELLNGGYELPERNAARRYIHADWGVVELGACIGVVACVTNKLLRDPTAHVVLEVNPQVIPHLQSNRDANDCSFKIVNCALAYNSSEISFVPQPDFWRNFIGHDGSRPPVTVQATQLSQILEEAQFEKYALICDIEGQEYELVMREAETLRNAELIIMEVHPFMIGEQKIAEILSILNGFGFKIIERSALVVVLSKGKKAYRRNTHLKLHPKGVEAFAR